MAEAIAAVCKDVKLPYIFKASYDKANRTSISSFRGPGLEEGCRILKKVRETVGVPVLTDVHDAHDCARVGEAVDVLQIPAFLCRQTDLLVAAAKTGRVVNVKKGQFVAPADMRHAVNKVREAGNDKVVLTERGSSFGYNNLVVDMRGWPSCASSRRSSSTPLTPYNFPRRATAQRRTAEFIPLLSRAAVAAGVDGIFMEVHDNPKEAKSDGANALDLKNLRSTLEQLLAVHGSVARP